MSKIAFVSDLHLFAKRSSADDYFDTLVNAAKSSDELILGGDIFDFRWSIHPSAEATADAAIAWLDELIRNARGTPVRFIFGNHDDHPLMHERLPHLKLIHDAFEWDRYYHRKGDTLFLHGDIADSKNTTAERLASRREMFEHGSRSPFQHQVYDLAVRAHLHQIAPPAVYPKKRVAKRILSYLGHISEGPETGIRHVCFGHTHRPINDYKMDGVTFHNCGAPIGSSKFRVVHRNVSPVATH